MINRLKIGLFILIITYNLINPQTKVFAVSCNAMSGALTITPSSGNTSTPFIFHGTINDCAGVGNNLRLSLQGSSGDPIVLDLHTDGSGTFTSNPITLSSAGSYSTMIRYGAATVVSGSSLSFNVSSGGSLKCGDPVDMGSTACPATCLPTFNAADGTTTCGPEPVQYTTPLPNPTFAPCKDAGCTGGAGIPCDPSHPEAISASAGAHGIRTAIGCIGYDPQTFVTTILKWIFGFAGGVALLLMILGAFQMVTSSGNPDALKSGQEQFSAALIGLVFVLLSVTLLQIIGVDILQIPGLIR